nr:nitric oxide-associated protein 1 [Nomia melanderi]
MHITRIGIFLSRLRTREMLCTSKLCYSQEAVVDKKVLALRSKLLYSDYLDLENVKNPYAVRKVIQTKELMRQKYSRVKTSFEDPISSVLLTKAIRNEGESNANERIEEKEETCAYMPHTRIDSYKTVDTLTETIEDDEPSNSLNQKWKDVYDKYLNRMASFDKNGKLDFNDIEEEKSDKSLPNGELWKVPSTWMTDFAQFDDTLMDSEMHKRYGTPNPSTKPSSVPCGGCGALLHCRDPEIPGYLPSELFLNGSKKTLKLTVCQRCHFLNIYNAALHVKVSIHDYPRLLSVIKRKKCAVILMIDLTDFPCSIWPDLKSVLHPFTPIFLVGNKVDLLPRDSQDFFENTKQQLLNSVINATGIKKEQVTHVALASAKTGYGIESLINKLQYIWRHKGDVYLIGCTNVGKSTMFNTLLKSDYCKVQATDLIQRATISAWPGTTLNLLKFPILNPVPNKVWLRVKRLLAEQKQAHLETKYNISKYRETRNMKYVTLKENVGRTFRDFALQLDALDPFSERANKLMERELSFDETKPEYAQSRWCYDTPGTIQSDQILDLLTIEELALTLSEHIITPRTFMLRQGDTVFVAGMGRLDLIFADIYVRCTLFTSRNLPITICYTKDADEVYEELLTTKAFAVPINDPKRLEVWPKLEGKELKVTGIDRNESVADVILSSIGWIAITPHENENVTLKAWTPQARGIHLRSPALLKKSVAFRGTKISGTPLYHLGRKLYIKTD